MSARKSKSLVRIVPVLTAFGLACSFASFAFAAAKPYALATCTLDQGTIAIDVLASANEDGGFDVTGFSFRRDGFAAVHTDAGNEESHSGLVKVADESGTPHYALESYRLFSLEGTRAPVKALRFDQSPGSGLDFGTNAQSVSVDGTNCDTNADNARIVLGSAL